MQLFNRFPSKVSIGLAGVALVVFAVIVLTPSPAPAQPVISWVPELVNETVLAGETKTVTVSFTASEDLGAVEVRVVPELEPYVTTNPTSFQSIVAGQAVNLDVTFSAPADSLPKVVEGTIQIRNVGRPPRTFARPLPVATTVFTGEPFDTLPDPDKLVEDNGEVYPVNQILVLLRTDLGIDSAKSIASEINAVIVGFTPSANLYLMEVVISTI